MDSYLALSAFHFDAFFVVYDTEFKILKTWPLEDKDNRSLGGLIVNTYTEIDSFLNKNELSLKRLYCVNGPGAFTALRMSASFMQGLALAKKLPLLAVSTSKLYDSPFYLPLRHLQARTLNLAEYQAQEFSVLEVHHNQEAKIVEAKDINTHATHFGFKDSVPFPSPEQLAKACQNSTELNSDPVDFKIQYGLNPKIFGERSGF